MVFPVEIELVVVTQMNSISNHNDNGSPNCVSLTVLGSVSPNKIKGAQNLAQTCQFVHVCLESGQQMNRDRQHIRHLRETIMKVQSTNQPVHFFQYFF